MQKEALMGTSATLVRKIVRRDRLSYGLAATRKVVIGTCALRARMSLQVEGPSAWSSIPWSGGMTVLATIAITAEKMIRRASCVAKNVFMTFASLVN
jgi:hypothetical protein